MNDLLQMRPYQPGDETAILELFQLTFGRPMTPDYWQWRFGNNPTGRIMIDLAVCRSLLAAHYAVSPVVVSVQGQDETTALSMTTMTHPDFRGQGLFADMAENVYRRMAADGMVMIWGFPNHLSHRGLVRDLNWTDIHEVPTFSRALAEGRPIPAPSAAVVELPGFDARFDLLWQEVKGRFRILTRRDCRYLTWRYGQNPENRYTVLGHVQEGRLRGYAILKRYLDSVDLVDLLGVDDPTCLDLVCGVARWAQGAGAASIKMWLNFTLPLHQELEKHGFRNTDPITYLGARYLQPEVNEGVFAFRNWYLTMGDSDVY